MIKKKLIFNMLIIKLILIWFTYSLDLKYPVKQVSKPTVECKFQNWNATWEECKMPLPIIENTNYSKYKDTMNYRLIYSILWWATYKWGWDIWYWWHAWVDIASAQWTPLYSIWEWTVEIAKFLPSWWNTVVIRHEFKGSQIRSIYAHMYNIQVSPWQKVNSWQRIWTIWTTWNSRGNHVHFQIDTNKNNRHPWYYINCIWSNADIVNKWLCREQMIKNTIDPIKFLESNWASYAPKQAQTKKEEDEYVQEIIKKEEHISKDEIVTREKIMLTELELFLARYPMQVKSNIPGNTMKVWENWTIDLSVLFRNRPFNWSLPMDLEVSFNSDVIKASPTKVIAVNDWKRKIHVNAVWAGHTRLIIKIWGKIIWNIPIRVVDDWTVLQANRWLLYNLWTNYIWSTNDWLIIMKDSNNSNIISVPYEWNFTLKSNENIKICPMWINSIRDISKIKTIKCWPKNWQDEIKFWYKDTLEGLFLFKIAPIEKWKSILNLYKGNQKIWSSKLKNIILPKDIDSNTKFRKDILNWLKKWYFTNYRQGNFAPWFDINEQDASNLIKTTFYPIAKDYKWSRFNKISRLDFMKMLSHITWLKAKNTDRHYRDVEKEDRKYSNILIDYWIELDKFGERYLQPDKNITRAEVAKILNTIRK